MIVEAIVKKTGQLVRVIDSSDKMHHCWHHESLPVTELKIVNIRLEDDAERARKGLKQI